MQPVRELAAVANSGSPAYSQTVHGIGKFRGNFQIKETDKSNLNRKSKVFILVGHVTHAQKQQFELLKHGHFLPNINKSKKVRNTKISIFVYR